jgi:hypothetical protein
MVVDCGVLKQGVGTQPEAISSFKVTETENL